MSFLCRQSNIALRALVKEILLLCKVELLLGEHLREFAMLGE